MELYIEFHISRLMELYRELSLASRHDFAVSPIVFNMFLKSHELYVDSLQQNVNLL